MGFLLKKILVTGSCGYLGASICKYLAINGHRVTAFTSFNPSKYAQWTALLEEVIVGDIRNEKTLSSLDEKKFDVVIHLVSLDHHKSENHPNYVSSINVIPTWNLLDRFTKKGIHKFIYFSTIHVYGILPEKIINEDQILAPKNVYGLTHMLSENICNYFNGKTDTECINIRLSNVYGSPIFKETNCWWLVINELCKTAYQEKKINLSSDGSPQRDFIHSSDLCRAIELIINSDEKNIPHNTFHISSRKTLTILELAHTVKQVYQDRYQKEINVILPNDITSFNPNKFEKVNKYIIDNTKLKSLGFSPEIKLSNGINEIFNYIENNF